MDDERLFLVYCMTGTYSTSHILLQQERHCQVWKYATTWNWKFVLVTSFKPLFELVSTSYFFGCLKNTHLGLVVQHILEAWNCSTESFFQKSFLHYLDALHKCMQKIVLMWSSLVKQFYLFKNNFSSKNILKCALSI